MVEYVKSIWSNNPSPNGCVFYLPLWSQGLSGPVFKSIDPFRHTCTVTEAGWGTTGRTFDGTNDKISCGTNANLYPAQFTWEAWVNLTDNTGNEIIMGTPTTVTPWEWQYSGGVGYFVFQHKETDSDTITANFTDLAASASTWYHHVVTADGSNIRGYLDGVISTDVTAYDGTIKTSDKTAIELGASRGSRFGELVIGEVRLYSRALSLAEIIHSYNATKWRYL